MDTPYPLVLTKQYKTQAPLWLEVIRRDESISILFFPKTDRLRRLQQLIDDKELLHKHLGNASHYVFEVINLNTVNIEDYFDLEDFLTRYLNHERIVPSIGRFDDCATYLKQNEIKLVLVLSESEKYATPGTKKILEFVSQLIANYSPSIMTLNAFEVNITHPTLLPVLPSSMTLYDNLFYYPLYTLEEALIFIKYLQQKWNKQIERKLETKIVEMCGGHFWLIKEAIREIVNSGTWATDSEGVSFRLNAIYKALIPSEQKLVYKCATKNQDFTDDEKRSLLYFKEMRVFNGKNKNMIPLLNDFVLNRNDLATTLVFTENHIYLNKVPIEGFFSRKEYRVFQFLLEHKGEIISRERLGNRIWPNNTKKEYSDWAMDQIIARIRKRLTDLSLSPKLLETLRGKGYRLRL